MLIVYQTGDQFFSFMIVDFGTAFKSGNLMKPAKIFDGNSSVLMSLFNVSNIFMFLCYN